MKVKVIILVSVLSMLMSKALANETIPLSANETKMVDKGYQLFLSETYSGKFKDGYYTDSNQETKVFDFWSNGKWMNYDRDNNGHHETIFEIGDSKLIYVGSIGLKGTFIDVGTGYKRFLNMPVTAWHKYQKQLSN